MIVFDPVTSAAVNITQGTVVGLQISAARIMFDSGGCIFWHRFVDTCCQRLSDTGIVVSMSRFETPRCSQGDGWRPQRSNSWGTTAVAA